MYDNNPRATAPGILIEYIGDGFTATYTVFVDGPKGWAEALRRALAGVALHMHEFTAITYESHVRNHKHQWTFTFFAR